MEYTNISANVAWVRKEWESRGKMCHSDGLKMIRKFFYVVGMYRTSYSIFFQWSGTLVGYIDFVYMRDVGCRHLPNILIGISEWPSELLFICVFWVQMTFFKHIEFSLGHFRPNPKLIGNPVIVARWAGKVRKKHHWANVLLGNERDSFPQTVMQTKIGISVVCCFWKQPQILKPHRIVDSQKLISCLVFFP